MRGEGITCPTLLLQEPRLPPSPAPRSSTRSSSMSTTPCNTARTSSPRVRQTMGGEDLEQDG